MTGSGTQWRPLCSETDFPEEGKLAAQIDGWSLLVIRTEQGLNALIDRCTHQAALLSPGRVRRGIVMCPLHGARFEVASGKCVGAAYQDLRRFNLRIVEVAIPGHPPAFHERPVPG